MFATKAKVNRLADDIMEFSDGSITREKAIEEARAYLKKQRFSFSDLTTHGLSQKMAGKAIAYRLMGKEFVG